MLFSFTIATAIADSAGWDHMGGWAWSGMVLGWVLMAVLVAIVGWALVGNGRSKPVNRAIEILDERYARGEIDKAEYNERRSDLDR
jgi:putative membrane protein